MTPHQQLSLFLALYDQDSFYYDALVIHREKDTDREDDRWTDRQKDKWTDGQTG